jgi:DNA polymerase-1
LSRWVYDIETNGLYPEATKMWILVAYNFDTGEFRHWLDGDLGWMEVFSQAEMIIGHNILGFDNLVLKKLFGFEFPKTCKFHDTLIFSRVLNYRRFGDRGHALAVWGDHLNFPKIDFHDWNQYTEEMKVYCYNDVKLNVLVYEKLLDEFMVAIEDNPLISTYLKAEHAVAKWCALAYVHGWPFDMEKALKLETILKKEMEDATRELEHKLGYKAVALDKCKGEIDVKEPKWVKSGFYHSHTANYFGVDPCSGFDGEERPIAGPYVRVSIEPLKLSSSSDVKIFLFRHGWEPTEYNGKWDPELRRKVETSPKITLDSLEFLGGDGKLYKDFLTASSRYGVLKGWIEATDENGLLHGDCKTIGTPSMRATHNIIVNVPAAESKWGREMRELFGSLPGWTLIGCDSASNQARGLAHFLGDEEFIDTLINGDIHTYNAKLLDKVITQMGHDWTEYLIKFDKVRLGKRVGKFLQQRGFSTETYLRSGRKAARKAIDKTKRASAKRVLYAFLFGASGKKLWSYIFGALDSANGNKLKTGFTKAVPGFRDLMDKLEKIYGSTKKFGEGYIPSLAGNRIYVDSFHKLLVYLLQSAEKITCSAAVMLIMERLEEAGIPYIPCIMMHDEADFMVPDEYADTAKAIGKKCFADGPKLFEVMIMDGGAKAGQNWYDIH